MSNPSSDVTLCKWRMFRSDQGRFWATRERAYDKAAEMAGAWRTLDGDTQLALCRAIAEQEAIADLVAAEVAL